MTKQDENQYILGTDKEELWRLGFQHQVWSEEARKGWRSAQFSKGQTFLDLGCGPGFCTVELAYMAGPDGKVIGIDKSKHYIDYLSALSNFQDLNITLLHNDFDSMQLEDNSIDRIYCRWAMAWIPNPEEIIKKLKKALKPNGKIVVQEYYDWSTLQIQPRLPGLTKGIAAAYKSFTDMEGEINIGRRLPAIFTAEGYKVNSIRKMNKLATTDDLAWHWPKTFFNIYLPKVMEMGLIDQATMDEALQDFERMEDIPGSNFMGPSMIEVIAEKV